MIRKATIEDLSRIAEIQIFNYKNRREKTGGRHNRVSYPIEKKSLKSGQY